TERVRSSVFPVTCPERGGCPQLCVVVPPRSWSCATLTTDQYDRLHSNIWRGLPPCPPIDDPPPSAVAPSFAARRWPAPAPSPPPRSCWPVLQTPSPGAAPSSRACPAVMCSN